MCRWRVGLQRSATTVNARYGPENQTESINYQVRIINNRGQSPTSCTDSMMES
jgi:hypothetical protein